MRPLTIIALIIGILMFLVLVSCDRHGLGSDEWDNKNTPKSYP